MFFLFLRVFRLRSFFDAAGLRSFAMIQSLSPVHLRAMASAMVLLPTNLVGLGLGPLVVGFLGDSLQPSPGSDSLRYALLVAVFSNVWAAVHFFWAGRTL